MKQTSNWLKMSLGAALLASACADDVPEVTPTGSDTGSTGEMATTTSPTIEPGTSTGIDSNTGSGSSGETTEGVDTTMGSTGPGPVCGDDIADAGEDCDGADLVGEDCMTQGFDDGELGCADDCTFDTSACISFSCGNDVIEGMEDCDGAELGGEDCLSQGFDAGDIGCADDCTFDTSGCVTFSCGNDMLEGMEVCDGTDLGGEDCITQGFDAGTLGCAGDCTLDTSGCVMFSCGNDVLEGMEVCDGTDLGGDDCITQGFDAGTLGCALDCLAFDTSGCVMFSCGNDVIEGMEVCDGTDLGGGDCITQGFDAGTLGCALDCLAYDTSGCIAFGGDCCAANPTPECDDAGCTAAICAFDAFCCNTEWDAQCANEALAEVACLGVGGSCLAPGCGNAVLEPGEACEGPDLGGEDCITQGFVGGILACDGACMFDTAGCAAIFAGDCCADTGTPGCDDAACTGAICAFDPFCCDTAWDAQCANEALAEPACQGVGGSCPPLPVCGNGAAEVGEACDGADLAGEDCVSQGFIGGGVLACDAGCGFDTAGCVAGAFPCADEDVGGLTGAAVTSGNTTLDDDDLNGSCGGVGGNDRVIIFTAPADDYYSFDTFGSAYDTKLSLYADCATELACNDDAGGTTQSQLIGFLLAGQSVLIAVDGFDGATGDWVLNITTGGGFACADEDIGGATGPIVTSGNTTLDDDDLNGSCGGAGGNDRVISFTAPATGDFVFDTFGSGYDTKLSLYAGCALEAACNDDTGGPQSELTVGLALGQTVLLVVDGFNGAVGDWVLNITAP